MTSQEYTTAVLEGRFATADYLRAELDSTPNLEQHDCGAERLRAVYGEINGTIVYCFTPRKS